MNLSLSLQDYECILFCGGNFIGRGLMLAFNGTKILNKPEAETQKIYLTLKMRKKKTGISNAVICFYKGFELFLNFIMALLFQSPASILIQVQKSFSCLFLS